uniref:Peptidyl-prolyl cis-trans isomerase n=1 Tax=Oncorhynchus mykiss TaxID=8022 RepID=A0A8C7P1E9_ONCMY
MSGIPPDTWQPPTVSLETTMGTIVVELYWRHAPKTCKNFAELARRGYYNNTKFHRIIKDFMVQGGDPTGTGRGGASIFGKQFEDELNPDLKFTGNYTIYKQEKTCHSNKTYFLCCSLLLSYGAISLPRCRDLSNGQCRTRHQRKPVLPYPRAYSVVGWEAQYLWEGVPRYISCQPRRHG